MNQVLGFVELIFTWWSFMELLWMARRDVKGEEVAINMRNRELLVTNALFTCRRNE